MQSLHTLYDSASDRLPANIPPANQNNDDAHPFEQLEDLFGVERVVKKLPAKQWYVFFSLFGRMTLSGFPTGEQLLTVLAQKPPKSLHTLILYLYVQTMHGMTFIRALEAVSTPLRITLFLHIAERCGNFTEGCKVLGRYYRWRSHVGSALRLIMGMHAGFMGLLTCVCLLTFDNNGMLAQAMYFTSMAGIILSLPAMLLGVFILMQRLLDSHFHAFYEKHYLPFILSVPFVGRWILFYYGVHHYELARYAQHFGGRKQEIAALKEAVLPYRLLQRRVMLDQQIRIATPFMEEAPYHSQCDIISANPPSFFCAAELKAVAMAQMIYYSLITPVLMLLLLMV